MIASIFSGIICMIGGLLLLTIREAGSQNLLGVIANGIGIYCIGKGLYVIFQGMELNEIKKIVRKDKDREIWDKFNEHVERIQESEKIGSIVERIYQRYCITASVRGVKKESLEELS